MQKRKEKVFCVYAQHHALHFDKKAISSKVNMNMRCSTFIYIKQKKKHNKVVFNYFTFHYFKRLKYGVTKVGLAPNVSHN